MWGLGHFHALHPRSDLASLTCQGPSLKKGLVPKCPWCLSLALSVPLFLSPFVFGSVRVPRAPSLG